MNQTERCTCRGPMIPRTNGNGLAYLECRDCSRVEAISRLADPYPTTYRTVVRDGKKGLRANRGDGRARGLSMHRRSYGKGL